jgi:hypothetical protein
MRSAEPMAPMPPMISGMYPDLQWGALKCMALVLNENQEDDAAADPSVLPSLPVIDRIQSSLYRPAQANSGRGSGGVQ